MARTLVVDPADLYFSHATIRRAFSDGRLLTDTLEEIQNGKLDATDLPRIKVIRSDDGSKLISMNNRRLWVLKELRRAGQISEIEVVLDPNPGSKAMKRLAAQRDLKQEAKPSLK